MATATLSVAASRPRHAALLHRRPNSRAPAVSSSSSSSASPPTSPPSPPPLSTGAGLQHSLGSITETRRGLFRLSIALLASTAVASEANATRIEYYATVGEPLCDYSYAKSGLGYCDISVGAGVQPPPGELINIHYTARFADGTVFDSSYKRGRPLTMRIGMRKVLPGLDQGILGGGGVPPMFVGGKRKLLIPPKLAYGPEPAGCFSGDCNIPGNATLLYDILFVGIYK